nr:MAG TPA: hypothetical protein [Caudoviricetes sp.]
MLPLLCFLNKIYVHSGYSFFTQYLPLQPVKLILSRNTITFRHALLLHQ